MWRPTDTDAWAAAHDVEPEIAEACFRLARDEAEAKELATDASSDDAGVVVRRAQAMDNKTYRYLGITWAPQPEPVNARAAMRHKLAAAVAVLAGEPTAEELSKIIRDLADADHWLRYMRLKVAA